MRSIDHDRVREFKVFVFQAPSFKKLTDFKSDLVDVCNSTVGKKWFESTSPIYSTYSVYSEDTIRFWKLELESSLSDMFTYTKSKCKRSTSYEYRIDFKGTYLLKDPEISLDEAEIADSDFVFLEVREQGRGWNFLGDGAIAIDKCEFCNKYEELPIKCGCDKVTLPCVFLMLILICRSDIVQKNANLKTKDSISPSVIKLEKKRKLRDLCH